MACSQDPLSHDVLIEQAAMRPMVICEDEVLSKLIHFYTKIHCLNQWGASNGDSFSIDPKGLPWVAYTVSRCYQAHF